MTHTGILSLKGALKNVLEVVTIDFTTIHEIEDYLPLVKVSKIGGLMPSEMKVIFEKGMIPIATKCNDCPCKFLDEDGNEIKGVQEIYLTPIDPTVENRNQTEWVKEIKKAVSGA